MTSKKHYTIINITKKLIKKGRLNESKNITRRRKAKRKINKIEEKYLVYIDYFVNKLSQYVDIKDTYYDKNILTK